MGRQQSVLNPGNLQKSSLLEGWQHTMAKPCEGLHISCIKGLNGGQWSFRSEGPPAFSINILLKGRIQTAFNEGEVMRAEAGSVLLMLSDRHSAGWNIFESQSKDIFCLVSIYLSPMALFSLTGLEIEELRQRTTILSANRKNTDSLLTVLPASSVLQRISSDLLNFIFSYPDDFFSRDLYLRAKAMEMVAHFLRENVSRAKQSIPIPSDRSRLLEAHALLERNYVEDWTVSTLAKTVGLNEKRLQAGFRALYGCSVHTCLSKIRLNAAASLLQKGCSVTDTAAYCGYASLSHFSRAFSKHSGITPKQYAMGFCNQK